MQKTRVTNIIKYSPLTVSTPVLAEMLGCGMKTATDIGTAAKGRIQHGKRVMWNVNKVQEYLDKIATE